MNFLEIMRLIVLLWPLIEQLIQAIGDEQERNEVADREINVIASLLNGNVPANNEFDVVSALAQPLKRAA